MYAINHSPLRVSFLWEREREREGGGGGVGQAVQCTVSWELYVFMFHVRDNELTHDFQGGQIEWTNHVTPSFITKSR